MVTQFLMIHVSTKNRNIGDSLYWEFPAPPFWFVVPILALGLRRSPSAHRDSAAVISVCMVDSMCRMIFVRSEQ